MRPSTATPTPAARRSASASARLLQAVAVVLALLCAATHASVASAISFPGCTHGAQCVVNTAITVTASTSYTHTGSVIVLEAGSVVCTTDYCELAVTVHGLLELRGTLRAPIVKVRV